MHFGITCSTAASERAWASGGSCADAPKQLPLHGLQPQGPKREAGAAAAPPPEAELSQPPLGAARPIPWGRAGAVPSLANQLSPPIHTYQSHPALPHGGIINSSGARSTSGLVVLLLRGGVGAGKALRVDMSCLYLKAIKEPLPSPFTLPQRLHSPPLPVGGEAAGPEGCTEGRAPSLPRPQRCPSGAVCVRRRSSAQRQAELPSCHPAVLTYQPRLSFSTGLLFSDAHSSFLRVLYSA